MGAEVGLETGLLEDRREDWQDSVFGESFMWLLKSPTRVAGIGIRRERVNQ